MIKNFDDFINEKNNTSEYFTMETAIDSQLCEDFFHLAKKNLVEISKRYIKHEFLFNYLYEMIESNKFTLEKKYYDKKGSEFINTPLVTFYDTPFKLIYRYPLNSNATWLYTSKKEADRILEENKLGVGLSNMNF